MGTIRFSISGMSCAGCVARVEKALEQVPGVSSANVNFAEHTAAVEGTAAASDLIAAISDAGYEAAELQNIDNLEEKAAAERVHYQSLLKKAGVAALIGISQLVAGMAGWLPAINPASSPSTC